jgi:hypothetical protein
MIRRSTLIVVEILLGLVAALSIGLGVAWWRLSQGPINLDSIRPQLEAQLGEARGGRPVLLDTAELAWSPRGALEIRALGVAMQDGEGAELSRSEEARIELAVLPMLIGRVQIERADLHGGQVTFTRKADGAVHVAFGPEGAAPDIIIPPPPPHESLLARATRVLDSMAATFRPVGPGGSLRGLSLRGATLTIIDEAGGGRWTAEGANFELARRGRALSLGAEASLEGARGGAPATLHITTDTRFRAATIEFGVSGARPRAILSPAALGSLAGLDAPLTANIVIGLDREQGVTRFDGDASVGRGTASTPAGLFRMDGGRFHGRYDIASDELIIDELSLAGTQTRIDGEIRVRDVSSILRGTPDQPAAFDVALRSLSLDLPQTFARPIALSNVRLSGAVLAADRSVRIDRLHAEAAGGAVNATGRIYWTEYGPDRVLTPGIEMHATATGELDVPTAIGFWPIGLGEGGRDYVARSLMRGRASNVTATLDIRPADIRGESMRNEAVDVRFDVADAELRFIETMSPVTGARGSGVLRGNRFDMTITQARINDLLLTQGRVEIPRLKPKGALATISARADGDTRRMMELLAQEPLDLRERLPVDIASVTGRGSVVLQLQRPNLREAPFEQWRLSINGSVRDFAGTMRERRLALSGGQLQIRGDHNAIVVSGPIRAGSSEIQDVRWTERIGRRGGAGSSSYQIAGVFDADDLVGLGYSIARYAQGRIGVVISGEGRGFDVENARMELNLTQAAITSPWRFWEKRAGEAASVRFTVERQQDGGLAFNGLDARGPDMSATGRVRVTRDARIADIDIARLAIGGRSDARIRATRAQDGALEVSVRGALFDAAPFMSGNDDELGAAAPGSSTASEEGPVRATVIVDQLQMRGGVRLSNARVDLAANGDALAMLTVEGRSPGNKHFSLGLGPRPSDRNGRLAFRADDAGFAVAALTGGDNVVGGTATAEGDWRAGPPNSARFNVSMRDFQVVRLPVMARLLSSAGSLQGMVGMLNGEGIGFERLDAQMTYANDRLIFTQGRMAGPSLGLTGAGAYNLDRDDLDVDGVIAPSPRLNLSMLGNVPVIGDLLISRRGEGVFGMTYSINGPAASPRVGVNPVSAMAPGILRRIFEPLSGPGEGDAAEEAASTDAGATAAPAPGN